MTADSHGFTPRAEPMPQKRATPVAAVELDAATLERLRHQDAVRETLAVITELADRYMLADLAYDQARPAILYALNMPPCYDVSKLPPLPDKDATTRERSIFALAVIDVAFPAPQRLVGIVRHLKRGAGLLEYGS